MKIKVRVRFFEEDIFIVPNTRVDKFDEMVEDYNSTGNYSAERDEIEQEFESYFGQYRCNQDEIQLWIDSKDK